jgi:hypothetical protein
MTDPASQAGASRMSIIVRAGSATCSRSSSFHSDFSPQAVTVDLEKGYGADRRTRPKRSGKWGSRRAVGGSIEDWDPTGRLYDIELALERIEAMTLECDTALMSTILRVVFW